MKSLQTQLQSGLDVLQVSTSVEQQKHYLDYLELLHKWNQAYNLSAVRDLPSMLSRHLFDSLSVVPYFEAAKCVDVGSGGGLPGIPLAITFPDRKFTLIDSNGKKTRFLFQAVQSLGLQNVTVLQSRVEDVKVPELFAGVISRAFSTIDAMLTNCSHLLEKGGKVYAMKGRYPEEELQQVGSEFNIQQVIPLRVPAEDGERHLVILEKQ